MKLAPIMALLAASVLNFNCLCAQGINTESPTAAMQADSCLSRAIKLHKKGKYKKAQKEFYIYEDNAKKYDSLYYYYRAFNDFYLKVYDSSKEYFLWNYEKDTSNYELLYYLGVSYILDSHNYEGSVYLSKYISHFPENNLAYYYLAEALYNEKQYHKSHEYYKKAVELGNKKAKIKLRRKFNGKLKERSIDDSYSSPKI